MRRISRAIAVVGAAAIMPFAMMTVVSPGNGYAAECGYGTVYDPPTDTCVALPPPPPPPPPAYWNGDITPFFSVGACAPLRFVSICGSI